MQKKLLPILYAMRVSFYIILITLLVNCSSKPTGFAFSTMDESIMSELERKYFQPRVFNRKPAPLLFNENVSIWVSYLPTKLVYGRPYAISLSQRSLGYIEMDLKNATLTSEIGFLIFKYSDLPRGQYLLRIALDNKVLESIEFEVINEDEQKQDFIDYEAPLDIVLGQETDDIKMYSR